jgi:beta-barrel assembly-enhancing protease
MPMVAQQASQTTPPGTAEQHSNAAAITARAVPERPDGSVASPAGVATEAQPAPDVLAIDAAELPKASEVELPVTLAPAMARAPSRTATKYDVRKIGDRHVGKGLDFYSLEREQQLGRQLAEDVEREARMVKDQVITEYVNRIGQRLVRNSDARVPFTIKVVDNDEVNAFALPGGFFYVNTGLILAAENEAELAGVMAHEIAHVAARHATKNATRSELFNLASIPLIFFGGPVGYAVRQAVGLAVPLSFLKFSRDAEREADMLGLQYQYASGYDPQEFVRFFERLHMQEKRKKHNFMARAFATHPMTGDRIKKAQEEIDQYLPPKDDYIVDTSEFDEVKERLQGLTHARGIVFGRSSSPTLRKRGPEPVESGKEEKPPRLERKTN